MDSTGTARTAERIEMNAIQIEECLIALEHGERLAVFDRTELSSHLSGRSFSPVTDIDSAHVMGGVRRYPAAAAWTKQYSRHRNRRPQPQRGAGGRAQFWNNDTV